MSGLLLTDETEDLPTLDVRSGRKTADVKLRLMTQSSVDDNGGTKMSDRIVRLEMMKTVKQSAGYKCTVGVKETDELV